MEAAHAASIPSHNSPAQAGETPAGMSKLSARRPHDDTPAAASSHDTRADFQKDGQPLLSSPAAASYHAVRPALPLERNRSTWANYVSASEARIGKIRRLRRTERTS